MIVHAYSTTMDISHLSDTAGAILADADGEYRALTVMMLLSDLWGHEESPTLHLREDAAGVAGHDMQKEFADWVKEVEAKPYVLIGT